MRRTVLTLTLVATAPLAAQQAKQPDAAPATSPPAGWTIRLDAKDSTKSASDTKFVTMGSGYHVTSGSAALYFNAKDLATGSYTVRATFGQRKPGAMGQPEAYGVFVGGTQLIDNNKQQYLYLDTDGQYGLRVNHGLDVHIGNFGVQK